MAQDRTFDAQLVIDPHSALLQQGHLWSISEVFTLPKGGDSKIILFAVGEMFTHMDFVAVANQDIESIAVIVSSFSAGTPISPFNRNSQHLGMSPTTKVCADVTIESEIERLSPVLYPQGAVIRMPEFIVNSITFAMEFFASEKEDARVSVDFVWHEHPATK
jgi:hypothetical protein